VETYGDIGFFKIDGTILGVTILGSEGANLSGARQGNRKDFFPSCKHVR
jgi:hypothetical protein